MKHGDKFGNLALTYMYMKSSVRRSVNLLKVPCCAASNIKLCADMS